MNNYIDADELIVEIERRKRQDITMRERSILNDIETAIESLQQEQPEVDLEKEIDGWYNTMGFPVTADALKETARHFYELGLNARKEDKR